MVNMMKKMLCILIIEFMFIVGIHLPQAQALAPVSFVKDAGDFLAAKLIQNSIKDLQANESIKKHFDSENIILIPKSYVTQEDVIVSGCEVWDKENIIGSMFVVSGNVKNIKMDDTLDILRDGEITYRCVFSEKALGGFAEGLKKLDINKEITRVTTPVLEESVSYLVPDYKAASDVEVFNKLKDIYSAGVQNKGLGLVLRDFIKLLEDNKEGAQFWARLDNLSEGKRSNMITVFIKKLDSLESKFGTLKIEDQKIKNQLYVYTEMTARMRARLAEKANIDHKLNIMFKPATWLTKFLRVATLVTITLSVILFFGAVGVYTLPVYFVLVVDFIALAMAFVVLFDFYRANRDRAGKTKKIRIGMLLTATLIACITFIFGPLLGVLGITFIAEMLPFLGLLMGAFGSILKFTVFFIHILKNLRYRPQNNNMKRRLHNVGVLDRHGNRVPGVTYRSRDFDMLVRVFDYNLRQYSDISRNHFMRSLIGGFAQTGNASFDKFLEKYIEYKKVQDKDNMVIYKNVFQLTRLYENITGAKNKEADSKIKDFIGDNWKQVFDYMEESFDKGMITKPAKETSFIKHNLMRAASFFLKRFYREADEVVKAKDLSRMAGDLIAVPGMLDKIDIEGLPEFVKKVESVVKTYSIDTKMDDVTDRLNLFLSIYYRQKADLEEKDKESNKGLSLKYWQAVQPKNIDKEKYARMLSSISEKIIAGLPKTNGVIVEAASHVKKQKEEEVLTGVQQARIDQKFLSKRDPESYGLIMQTAKQTLKDFLSEKQIEDLLASTLVASGIEGAKYVQGQIFISEEIVNLLVSAKNNKELYPGALFFTAYTLCGHELLHNYFQNMENKGEVQNLLENNNLSHINYSKLGEEGKQKIQEAYVMMLAMNAQMNNAVVVGEQVFEKGEVQEQISKFLNADITNLVPGSEGKIQDKVIGTYKENQTRLAIKNILMPKLKAGEIISLQDTLNTLVASDVLEHLKPLVKQSENLDFDIFESLERGDNIGLEENLEVVFARQASVLTETFKRMEEVGVLRTDEEFTTSLNTIFANIQKIDSKDRWPYYILMKAVNDYNDFAKKNNKQELKYSVASGEALQFDADGLPIDLKNVVVELEIGPVSLVNAESFFNETIGEEQAALMNKLQIDKLTTIVAAFNKNIQGINIDPIKGLPNAKTVEQKLDSLNDAASRALLIAA